MGKTNISQSTPSSAYRVVFAPKSTTKRKRCSKGFKKDKQGNCQPKSSAKKVSTPSSAYRVIFAPKSTTKRKRCPNGTRKNKQGNCEPKK